MEPTGKKRILSREVLTYAVFGLLTTVVNYIVFGLMLKVLGEGSALIANAIAFAAAVLFAFLTNKPFVFKSKCWKIRVVCREFVVFVSSRLATFGVEELGLYFCQDHFNMDKWTFLGIDGLIYAKLGLSLLTVILNYIFGKFLVFRKPRP